MRFDEHLAAKMHAAQPRAHLEYPKYIEVGGKAVLVQNAAEEREALGLPDDDDSDESGAKDAPGSPENLLSTPEKRPRGRPVGWRKPVLVSPAS